MKSVAHILIHGYHDYVFMIAVCKMLMEEDFY